MLEIELQKYVFLALGEGIKDFKNCISGYSIPGRSRVCRNPKNCSPLTFYFKLLTFPRMTKEELLKELKQTLTKTKVEKLAGLAVKAKDSIEQILGLTFRPEQELAFRAAWILEHIFLANPTGFFEHLTGFVSAYNKQKNLSCQRHYTKIMMEITSGKVLPGSEKADFETVVETTFAWLIDDRAPVAVQVNCLDILYNLSSRFDWIKDELKAQTEFFLRDGSAAMQSRGKKILKKLK